MDNVIKKNINVELTPRFWNMIMIPKGGAINLPFPVKTVLSYTPVDAKAQADAKTDWTGGGILEAVHLPDSNYTLEDALKMSEQFMENRDPPVSPQKVETEEKYLVSLLKDRGYVVYKKK